SYGWNIGAKWAAGAMGAWRGASSSPVEKASGSTMAGASPVSDSAPSLTPGGNSELQVFFYAAQSGTAPRVSLSNALNQRFNVGSSREGFALAFADAAAPAANNVSPTYPATASISGSAAMTAQAI